jgi:hypothetical protein
MVQILHIDYVLANSAAVMSRKKNAEIGSCYMSVVMQGMATYRNVKLFEVDFFAPDERQ